MQHNPGDLIADLLELHETQRAKRRISASRETKSSEAQRFAILNIEVMIGPGFENARETNISEVRNKFTSSTLVAISRYWNNLSSHPIKQGLGSLSIFKRSNDARIVELATNSPQLNVQRNQFNVII